MIVYLTFMGFDFVADIDYRITSYGSPPHMGSLSYPGDPGDPPEWEIDSIVLQRDDLPPEHLCGICSPRFEATGALFDVISELPAIKDAVLEDAWNDAHAPEYDDY